MKTKIIKNVIEVETLLKRVEFINPPISINNNGKVCDSWGVYDDSKYKFNENNCIKINNSTKPKCLSNNIVSSCSNYYNDGEIDRLSKIDIKELSDMFLYNNIVSAKDVQYELHDYNIKLNSVLDDLIEKRNLENQQLIFRSVPKQLQFFFDNNFVL